MFGEYRHSRGLLLKWEVGCQQLVKKHLGPIDYERVNLWTEVVWQKWETNLFQVLHNFHIWPDLNDANILMYRSFECIVHPKSWTIKGRWATDTPGRQVDNFHNNFIFFSFTQIVLPISTWILYERVLLVYPKNIFWYNEMDYLPIFNNIRKILMMFH